ncbi:protein ITPRID2 isoform X2 [Denticeps clupeoides]|uniref:ITPR-interacting domain-containing protein n=1 Tax=Denticeps clupeoides TaxID=299321 RepID=A0AAY4EVE9_9TELE|nr:protein ITPRID2 isoform X2 [Denticeps clupeoides]XP_028847197.1 protein ITPRID2 isoform X2 [Denticeps clupeoides]
MEQCESSTTQQHPWKAAMKRRAWAQSRDSWQGPESQDSELLLSEEPMEEKPSPSEESGPIPIKIASWLKDCRSPLGASLDEQSATPTKGVLKNFCSFEDDLSLGAEANYLEHNGTKTEPTCYGMPAQEKRSQFRQKARSMNSTGSGKSNTTVSSVSELLDLYEEDPEEILYNLGFGREEPSIGNKVPSRFFSSASGAKGIDIKIYLEAQMQRMELENPSFALTSRFRQIEVLTTVANAFSSLYSQVSGLPVEKIGNSDSDPKELNLDKKPSPALAAAKILKKTISRQNLLASGDCAPNSGSPPADSPAFRKKDSPPLATVTEEALQSSTELSIEVEIEDRNGTATELPVLNSEEPMQKDDHDPALETVLNGEDKTPKVNASRASEVDMGSEQVNQEVVTSTPDKEPPSNFLPNPHINHLRNSLQPRDSFEMDELQEDEPGTRSTSRAGSEQLLRTASQQSDSSGFAEDPSTDASSNLKEQDSSDSCDSETTVTSNVGDVSNSTGPEAPTLDVGLQSTRQTQVEEAEKIPGYDAHQTGDLQMSSTDESDLTTENRSTPETVTEQEPGLADVGLGTDQNSDTSPVPTTDIDLALEPGSNSEIVERRSSPDHHTAAAVSMGAGGMSASERVRVALHRAQLRSSSVCEERLGRVWVKSRDLLRVQERNPFQRSSSLPDPQINPTRMVSSVYIELGQGTRSAFSYHYTPEPENQEQADVNPVQHEEADGDGRCRSTLIINSSGPVETGSAEPQLTDGPFSRLPPYPLHLPSHLNRSTTSLYSVPQDWPARPLGEGHSWSTWSVPNLTQHTHVPKPPLPRPLQFVSPYSQSPYGSPYNSLSSSLSGHFNPPPNASSTAPLHNAYFAQPPSSTEPHTAPYVQPPYGSAYYPLHHQPHPAAPFSSSVTHLHHSTLPHTHSAPYSLSYSTPPVAPAGLYGHPYGLPYPGPASYPLPHEPAPSSAPSSTEMQLRRVLHEIRGAVQNLSQSSSVPGEESPCGTYSPQRSLQPLYEELQLRRKSLIVFRRQMMDIELALMRQQSQVYQHLSHEEKREAEQLQRLRAEVRQELQELELQLEERLHFLSEQLRSVQHPGICRHPMGHSMDSLSNESGVRAMELVSDLLREQLYLQSELGYDGSVSVASTPRSGLSSRSASPVRMRRTSERSSEQRGGLFRSTLSLTPAIPPRPGVDSPQPTASDREETMTSPEGEGDRGPAAGGADRAADNPQLQTLIKEIRDSIADEIRKEIVNELLAAVSPRRSPVTPREQPL